MKTKWSLLVTLSIVTFVGTACGGDEEEPAADATTPVAVETTIPTLEPTVTETVTAAPTVLGTGEDGPDGGTAIQGEQIVECLSAAGMEAKAEAVSLPIYGEETSVAVTFEFESVGATVPDAVEVLLFPDGATAAKAKPKIDENLLEGDTPTVLIGNAVLDDFGSTLEEPEAADQTDALIGCVEEATAG